MSKTERGNNLTKEKKKELVCGKKKRKLKKKREVFIRERGKKGKSFSQEQERKRQFLLHKPAGEGRHTSCLAVFPCFSSLLFSSPL